MELGVDISDLLKTLLLYCMISTFVFVSPSEFRSFGFTLDNIFYKLLGNKQSDFLSYQLKRICLTQISHILFFPAFFVVLGCFSNQQIFSPKPENWIQSASFITLLVSFLAISVVFYLSTNNFANHYVVKKLTKQHHTNWKQLSRDVTRELNDPFAIRAVDSGESAIYVLDKWLLRVTVYDIELVMLDDTRFTVVKSIEHPMGQQNDDFQIILLKVDSVSFSFTTFEINLQSRNIMQLIRDKVGSRFMVSPDVSLSVSTVDRFVQTFRALISEHETFIYRHTEELENCFGCFSVKPNVKLQHNCDGQECAQCNCRPMWCHSCLARVFVSEQDPEAPHQWLRGTARCPVCRNRFCIIDVLPMQVEII